MPFPTSVNITQAPAIAGDFASVNPRHATPGGIGAWVAGSGGVTVGAFGWGDLSATDTIVASNGSGLPAGFVARQFGDPQIVTFLAENSSVILQGTPVPLFSSGDFWAKNSGSSTATIGMKAFANLTTGLVSFAAAGSTVTGSIETKFYAVGFGGGTGLVGEVVKISSVSLD